MTGLIIAITLGWAGGYQFYKHKTGMGILYLLTGGLFCIGWVMDIIKAYNEYSLERQQDERRNKIIEELRSQGCPEDKIPAMADWIKWKDVDGHSQDMRIKRALDYKELTVVSINAPARRGVFASSSGNDRYYTTLSDCSCPDFQKRHLPCKHMYYLADKCGVLEDITYGNR